MMYEVNPLQQRQRWYLTFGRLPFDLMINDEINPPAYSKWINFGNFEQEKRGGINGGGVYLAKAGSTFIGWGEIIPGWNQPTFKREETEFNVEQEILSPGRRRNLWSRYRRWTYQSHFVQLFEDVEYHKVHTGVIFSRKRWKRTLEEKITYPNFQESREVLKDETELQDFQIDLSPIEFPHRNQQDRRYYLSTEDPDNFVEDEEMTIQIDQYGIEELNEEGEWITAFNQDGAYRFEKSITYDYSDPDHLDTCSPPDFMSNAS